MHRNDILFNWTNRYNQLSAEDLSEWWNGLDGRTASNVTELLKTGQAGEKWLAARDMYHQGCLAQVKRLGLTPASNAFGEFSGTTLIERVVGHDAGQKLIKRWEFRPENESPDSMWDIMDMRVDDEAVIGLIGDDRGWSENWVYMIIVAWYPKEVHNEWPPETALR